MKLALVADIHGNSIALDAVLGELGSEPTSMGICFWVISWHLVQIQLVYWNDWLNLAMLGLYVETQIGLWLMVLVRDKQPTTSSEILLSWKGSSSLLNRWRGLREP